MLSKTPSRPHWPGCVSPNWRYQRRAWSCWPRHTNRPDGFPDYSKIFVAPCAHSHFCLLTTLWLYQVAVKVVTALKSTGGHITSADHHRFHKASFSEYYRQLHTSELDGFDRECAGRRKCGRSSIIRTSCLCGGSLEIVRFRWKDPTQ